MRRKGKAEGRNPEMHGREKSDRSVVPMKPPNKAEERKQPNQGRPYTGTKAETPETAKGRPKGKPAGETHAAEVVEGRGLTLGNMGQQNALRTQCRAGVESALDRVRQRARKDKEAKFTALLHHVTVDRLRKVYLRLKPKAAPGVDGITWKQYGEKLEGNLQELHACLHRGAYRAKPSRRAYIPKADGRLRPLGIAALEDKIVQGAVVEVLNAIYEEDFLGFSYGCRPERNQHQALDALAYGIHARKVNWVLDADIRDFFGTIDHEWLIRFVEHRIGDRRVLRLIRQWLAAGVMENGSWARSESGTPQGATVSPLLANIYLHYVLDVWAHRWRKKRERGDVVITRYVDDFVVCFQHLGIARWFRTDLRERMRKFGLELHPDKTRLLEFGRYAVENRGKHGGEKPESFTFLGLTHICGRGANGGFQLLRRTEARRVRAKLREVKTELMRRRHHSIPEQGAWLRSVVKGFNAYYAVPTNTQALESFRNQVGRHWSFALRRRSQKGRVKWSAMEQRLERWLPRPRILHPWPEKRFEVTHPR